MSPSHVGHCADKNLLWACVGGRILYYFSKHYILLTNTSRQIPPCTDGFFPLSPSSSSSPPSAFPFSPSPFPAPCRNKLPLSVHSCQPCLLPVPEVCVGGVGRQEKAAPSDCCAISLIPEQGKQRCFREATSMLCPCPQLGGTQR